MPARQKIKSHYLFNNDEEAETLKALLPIAEEKKGRQIDALYDYLLGLC